MIQKINTFEEAMKELEQITIQMQNKELPLEEALKAYEQGKQLVQFCQDKLNTVEQKIKILNKNNELSGLEIE